MSFSLSFLRLLTLLLYCLREVYWNVIERKANKEKPKTRSLSQKDWIKRIAYDLLWGVLVLQLLGIRYLPFPHTFAVQLIGFSFAVVGVSIGVFARKKLGTNWTAAAEYQIKIKHNLITTGIYKLVRHPI